MIEKATLSQLPQILKIYEKARKFMSESGNPTQWGTYYPTEEMIRQDILTGKSYVNLKDGNLCAVFYFAVENDPTYGYIDGAWLNDAPYGVIHRIAGDGSGGILKTAVAFAQEKSEYLRIDTHEENTLMQRALAKLGFRRCGIIHLANGDPRIAYDRI